MENSPEKKKTFFENNVQYLSGNCGQQENVIMHSGGKL
jgi:hypothetical protein